jgi:parvulin-like peptidyl-prolyl isomerase
VDPGNAPDRLVDAVGGEELMRRGAPDKGVDVSDEAIEAEIRVQGNVRADADQNTFAAAYRQAVQDSGLSTEGYRDVIAAGLAQDALSAKFVEEAPKNADQVRFRVIVLSIEDDAKTTLDRLRNGEDFAVVAQEVSEDTASSEQGGERDWTPRGILEPVLEEALFSLEIGQTSEIIPGESAYFIVQVLERQDQRETTAEQQSGLGNRAMTEWLRQLRDSIGVTVKLDNDQRGSILKVLQSEVAEGQ